MPTVTRIEPKHNKVLEEFPLDEHKLIRAAAYARVSTDSDEQFTSFAAQVSYYTQLIESNPEYKFVKVYADEGISGTMLKKRKGFNEMMAAARRHEFDLLFTKSLSRFARNTVDSISAIRELKDLGIDVYFEEQRLHTINATGELIITILSALAQEESRNISENVKWGIRKSFADGKVLIPYKSFLGYKKGKNGIPEIDEEGAEIVKLIYRLFWEGKSTHQIAKYLNENKVPMPSKKTDADGNYIYKWQPATINSILTNEKYKGEAILQKTYTEDFLTHKKVKNSGTDIPIYHVKESHPFIIPVEEWEMVQVEMERRNKMSCRYSGISVFGSKIICGDCGSTYGQKVWHSTDKYRRMIYQCNRKFSGKKTCKTPTINEEIIKKAFVESCHMMSKANLIEDLQIGLKTLENHKTLDDRIMELVIECDALNESARKLIEEKKKGNINLKEAESKYEILVKKHKEVSEELQSLEKQRSKKAAAAYRIKMNIEMLKNEKLPINGFQIKWWTLLLEKAVVYDDKRIEFIYYCGYKNEVKFA